MARRVSISQFKNMLREAERKQRQAIDKYNREVRAHNQKVKQAVDQFNREVRAYNALARSDRQRLENQISKLKLQTNTTRYVTYRTSVNAVQTAYERLEHAATVGRLDERYNDILDLSEREAANNAGLMNALLDDEPSSKNAISSPAESHLTPILAAISSDLADRWQGALFSLSPHNPDAARHFCTSAREIITQILDTKAPNDAIVSAMPNCERTQQGTPTRRTKIRYILHLRSMEQDDLEEFIERDMENIVQLFYTFNQGTHGLAGQFNFTQLQAIRKRVEDGIMFLSKLIH